MEQTSIATGETWYTGHVWDQVLDLYEDHARSYDPRTGRFLQQDPIQSDTVNAYR